MLTNNSSIEHKRMTPIGNTSLVLKRGAWTAKEDAILKNYIEKFGEGKWHLVPLRAGLNRCRKSCRLRWLNYLRPNIKRGDFEEDEVDLIHRLHRLLGNRWSLIAGRIPGRTSNDVKNYWNTYVRPRTKRQKGELKESEPRQKVELKEDEPTQHEMVRVIKPKAHTISKSSNMYPHITPHDKGKLIISSNDSFNNSSKLVPPLTISDYKIDEYLDELFEDHKKKMNEEIPTVSDYKIYEYLDELFEDHKKKINEEIPTISDYKVDEYLDELSEDHEKEMNEEILTVSDYKVDKYLDVLFEDNENEMNEEIGSSLPASVTLDVLFEDNEKEMNEEIGWSLPASVTLEGGDLGEEIGQEYGETNLFNFPIDDVFSSLLD